MGVYMRTQTLLLFSTILTISLVFQAGCSEQGCQVAGVVTLDGQPLSKARVEFIPTSESGRIAIGRTDADGEFKLATSKSVSSVFPGQYKVRITTSVTTGTSDADLKTTPEKVPAKYNKRTKLTSTVEDGLNQLDFELLTK